MSDSRRSYAEPGYEVGSSWAGASKHLSEDPSMHVLIADSGLFVTSNHLVFNGKKMCAEHCAYIKFVRSSRKSSG